VVTLVQHLRALLHVAGIAGVAAVLFSFAPATFPVCSPITWLLAAPALDADALGDDE
jgi:hypothetical protein